MSEIDILNDALSKLPRGYEANYKEIVSFASDLAKTGKSADEITSSVKFKFRKKILIVVSEEEAKNLQKDPNGNPIYRAPIESY